MRAASRGKAKHMRSSTKLALMAGSAAAYAATTGLALRGISDEEREAFAASNHQPRRDLYKLPEQLGTPAALLGLGAVGLFRRDLRLFLAAPVCLALEKAAEVGTKKIVQRRRPAGDRIASRIHPGAPTDGPSYPSGHAAIATCVVTLLYPRAPFQVTTTLGLASIATAVARVHQGAHFPLDSVGGLALGVSVAAAVQLISPAVGGLASQAR